MDPAYGNDVKRAYHDRVDVIGKGHHDLLTNNCCVLGMFHAEDLSAAAVNLKRPEWRVSQEASHLLKHAGKLQLERNTGKLVSIPFSPLQTADDLLQTA